MKQIFTGIFIHNNKLLTRNFAPGSKVYGEQLLKVKGKEYRVWNPFRSKLAAAIKNGLKEVPVKEGSNVLYLGVAEGTTASHLGDVIGEKGILFGIDVSERTMRKFILICEERSNLVPVLADANNPDFYAEDLKDLQIDLLYQDVAQKNQAEIFLKNAKFLKSGAKGLIAIKARSISQKGKARKIFENETVKLEKEFKILQQVPLKPFEKEHLMVLVEKK